MGVPRALRPADGDQSGLRRPVADRVRGQGLQRHPRPGGGRPHGAGRATSPTAPAPAPRSTWSSPPRPSPCSAAATTRCPRTSTRVAHDVLRHRLVLSYEALADDVTADDVLDASSPPSRCPRSCSGSASALRRRQDMGDHRPADRRPGPPPARVAGDPPARRPAAGQLPHAVPRPRHRLPRPPRVRAGRRRPPHRLERHRPHGRACSSGSTPRTES